MASFPEPAWFLALGRLMEAEGELFRRLGYAETRFVVRVIPNKTGTAATIVGLAIDGYRMTDAKAIVDLDEYDPDFVICAKRAVWDRMLDEITEHGRPRCGIR